MTSCNKYNVQSYRSQDQSTTLLAHHQISKLAVEESAQLINRFVVDPRDALICDPVECVRAEFHQLGHAPKREATWRLLLLLLPVTHEFC